MKLKVIIHPEPGGGYWAEVPALPGCVTQGETLAELRANVREAAAAAIETLGARAARPAAGARVLEMSL